MKHLEPVRRIRLTFYSDAEYFGGAEEYLVLLARHLDRTVFAPDLVLPDVSGAGILESRMRGLGVPVRHLRRLGPAWLSGLRETVRALRDAGGEVLHLNLPSPYDGGVSAVAWAARQAGYRRVVSTEHLPMVDRKYRQFPVKLFFSRWIDRIIVPARATRRLLIRRHGMEPDRVTVVPNGVEDAPPFTAQEREDLRRSWGAGPDTVVLGIVGRLTPRKGHHDLLEALEPLAVEPGLPPWMLIAVGEGEEADRLRSLGAELERTGRLRWLGQREDAPRLMQAFDLLTLPSTMETMPLTLLEGMAARLPIVASAIYGIPEVVEPGETGWLVPPRDPQALRARLRQLLRDRALRRAMGLAGRARYEKEYTALGMATATAAILRPEVWSEEQDGERTRRTAAVVDG
jgi:glycosyltransferase involved in cell wall biosynthesis